MFERTGALRSGVARSRPLEKLLGLLRAGGAVMLLREGLKDGFTRAGLLEGRGRSNDDERRRERLEVEKREGALLCTRALERDGLTRLGVTSRPGKPSLRALLRVVRLRETRLCRSACAR